MRRGRVISLADALDVPSSSAQSPSINSWDIVSPPTPLQHDDNSKDDKQSTTEARPRYIYHNKTYETFASVKGQVIHGLLIDPGAARGLIGADTLKDIIQYVLKPHGKQNKIKWHKSTNKFTGISAESQQSLGQCEFPIGLKGLQHCTFHADVIGGKGSTCPGLVPCHSLQNSGCLIAFGYFPNGDSLLGIRATNGNFVCQRLLATDSGHTLLPIHHFNTKTDSKLDTLILHESRLLTKSFGKIPRSLQQQDKHHAFPVGLVTDDKDTHDTHHAEKNEMTAPPELALTTSSQQHFQ